MPSFTETAIRLYRRLFGAPATAGQLPEGIETVLDGATAVAITEACIADTAALGSTFPASGGNLAWQSEQERSGNNMFGGLLSSLETEGARGALAAACGLSLSGRRAAVFLDSHELATAQDLLRSAAGRHLPMVVHLANRALAAQGAALGSGHEALHLSGESGVFTLFASNVQQAVDFTLIARRVAELALTPAIVVMDGELTAESAQEVKLPSVQLVKQFIGATGESIPAPNTAQKLLFGEERRRTPQWHSLDRPVLNGALQDGESYALGNAAQRPFFGEPLQPLLVQAFEEFGRLTGRHYATLTRHNVEKAPLLLIAQGAAVESAIALSDQLRTTEKLKVGVVGINTLRPLPGAELAELLRGRKVVAVLERTDTPLAGDAPLLRELRAALDRAGENGRFGAECHPGYPALREGERPRLLSALYGLGGLPLRHDDLAALCREMGEKSAPVRYLGLEFHRHDTVHPKRQVLLDTLRRHYPEIAGLGLCGNNSLPVTAPEGSLTVAVHRIAGEGNDALAMESASFLHQLLGGQLRSRAAASWERWGVPLTDRLIHAPNGLLDGALEGEADVAVVAGDISHPRLEPVKGLRRGGLLLVRTQGEENMLPAVQGAMLARSGAKVYALNDASPLGDETTRERLLGALFGMLHAEGRLELKPRRIIAAREESHGHLGVRERTALIEAFQQGFDSVTVIETSASAASPKTTNGWCDEAPVAVRHLGAASSVYDSLPRFWDQVGVLYRNGEQQALTADPYLATGVMPPLSATFRDLSPARTTLPRFDAERCTACGKCWSACPDSAIGAVALSPRKLVDTGIRLASADAVRQVASKLAGRLSAMGRKGEFTTFEASALLQQAFDWLKEKAPLPEERQHAVDADFAQITETLAGLPLSLTAPLFELAEKAQKDSGELLSLVINPDSCKGCGLCATVCADEAMIIQPQDEAALQQARAQWLLWQQTPDTDSATIERLAKLSEVGPMAAVMLSRHCAFALSGGDGAEAGSGEKIAVRQVLAATEYQQQPLLHRFIGEIAEVQEALTQRIRDTLADALPSADLERLSAGLKAIHTREASLAAFLPEGEESIEGSGVDTHQLRRLVALAQGLSTLHWRLAQGEHGLGRSRFGLAIAPGSAAAWAGAFPHNPFQAPVVVDMSGDAPQIAAGLLQGQLDETIEAVSLLRRARAALDAKVSRDSGVRLAWGDLSEEEQRLCPPLILIGNDESLGGRGFAQLAWLLNSALPVKVVLLADLDMGVGSRGTGVRLAAQRDARTNLGLMALSQRRAYVAQSSFAAPEHLRQSVREALRFTGPALLSLYAPSPERHGFAPGETLAQAEQAVLSRAFPLFRYHPEGEGVFGSRLTLEGNPALRSDWFEAEEATRLTPAHWALGQRRFAARIVPLAADAPAPTPLLEWLALEEEKRSGKSPWIAVTDSEGNSARYGVDTPLASAVAQLRDGWRTLQELSGLVTPFTKRVEQEAREALAVAHQAELDALRREYEEKLRALEEGMASRTHEQITRRLMEIAGYGDGSQPN